MFYYETLGDLFCSTYRPTVLYTKASYSITGLLGLWPQCSIRGRLLFSVTKLQPLETKIR